MNINVFQKMCKQHISFFFFSSLGRLRFESLHDFSHTDELFPERKKAVGVRKTLNKQEHVPDGFLDCVRSGGVSLPDPEELEASLLFSSLPSVLFLSLFFCCYIVNTHSRMGDVHRWVWDSALVSEVSNKDTSLPPISQLSGNGVVCRLTRCLFSGSEVRVLRIRVGQGCVSLGAGGVGTSRVECSGLAWPESEGCGGR